MGSQWAREVSITLSKCSRARRINERVTHWVFRVGHTSAPTQQCCTVRGWASWARLRYAVVGRVPSHPYVQQACGAEVRSALPTPVTVQHDGGAGSRRISCDWTGRDHALVGPARISCVRDSDGGVRVMPVRMHLMVSVRSERRVAERSKPDIVRTRTYDIKNLHPLSSRPFSHQTEMLVRASISLTFCL